MIDTGLGRETNALYSALGVWLFPTVDALIVASAVLCWRLRPESSHLLALAIGLFCVVDLLHALDLANDLYIDGLFSLRVQLPLAVYDWNLAFSFAAVLPFFSKDLRPVGEFERRKRESKASSIHR